MSSVNVVLTHLLSGSGKGGFCHLVLMIQWGLSEGCPTPLGWCLI